MRALSEFVINNWFVLTSHILSHQKVLEQTKPNNGTKQGNLHKLNLAKKKYQIANPVSTKDGQMKIKIQ